MTGDELRDAVADCCSDGFLYLHLEPTNACNTTCEMCPRDQMTRRPNMMHWGVFESIMNIVLPSPLPMLSFVGFGEPTLHRRLPDMIAHARARRPDILMKLTTNGSVLDSSRMELLYERGLDFAEVSVVGTSPADYERSTGLAFDRIAELVVGLTRARRQFALTTVESERASVVNLREFWQSVGAQNVHVKQLHRRGGYAQLRTRRELHGEYLVRSPDARDGSVGECHKLSMFLHVNASGKFIPCVQEINDKNIQFDISEVQSYAEVCERIKALRPVFDICAGCELKAQDGVAYYARFLARYFPDTAGRLVEGWRAKLANRQTLAVRRAPAELRHG